MVQLNERYNVRLCNKNKGIKQERLFFLRMGCNDTGNTILTLLILEGDKGGNGGCVCNVQCGLGQ